MSSNLVNVMRTYQQRFPALTNPRLKKHVVVENRHANSGEITVGRLLRAIQPMPVRSILLGQCMDGLPFLMDIGNPEMGAILICCEDGFGKTHQLQVMVDSAIRMRSHRDLQIAILSLNTDEWRNLEIDPSQEKYLHGVYAWYDDQAEKTIQELTDLAEARRQGVQQGADVLFILDDLNFVEELSYESQVNLRWLLEYGSQSGVWLIGTICARHVVNCRYWVDTFRTRVMGRVLANDTAEILSMGSPSHVEGLDAGFFRVWAGRDWVDYRLPPLGD